jgi:hypothetical protein
MAKMLKNGTIDRVPVQILNLKKKQRIKLFLDALEDFDIIKASKTCQAGIMYLKKQINDGTTSFNKRNIHRKGE